MTQVQLAQDFAALHRKGDPLILFNIWDAGSARAVAEAGARALATGSWSVAAALGFKDGEDVPLDLVLANAERIVRAVDLPVTIDFEGGYARGPDDLAANLKRLIATGAVGCNFEDRIVGGEGRYAIDEQSARVAALREAADRSAIPFFINARTDIFLQNDNHTEAHLEEALARAEAYAGSGASGFFAPGLTKPELIRKLCDASPLPVNIMMFSGVPSPAELAALGVARISYGPGPYREMSAALTSAAARALGTA